MPNWLYSDFEDNTAVYQKAQMFWERHFRQSLPRVYFDNQLKLNYLNNPDCDGNPIFSGICHPLRLAVRVIQQPVGNPDDIDLDWWVESIGPKNGRFEIRELVISCCPSEENLPEVKRILREWLANGEITSTGFLDEDPPWEGRSVSFAPELCLR